MNSAKLNLIPLVVFVLWVGVCIQTSSALSQSNDRVYLSAVDWSPDGNQIVAIGFRAQSDNGYIFIIDAMTGETLSSWDTMYGGYASVDWSPDGRLIAVGGYDQTVRVIDVLSGEVAATLTGHRGVVNSVDWNSSGSLLVSSSPVDQQVILWDMYSYQAINVIEIGDPWSVAFSPNDQTVAVGGIAGLFVFPASIDVVEGTQINQYRYFNKYVGAIAWSRDGTQIAIGTQGFRSAVTGRTDHPEVYVFDSQNRTTLSDFEVVDGDKIYGIAWSPNGAELVTYSTDGSVKLWEVETGMLLDVFSGNSAYIETGIGFSPYGGRLAYGYRIDSVLQADFEATVGSGIAIVVPYPSVERLKDVASACAPDSLKHILPSTAEARLLSEFVARVRALPASTIPAACAADLIAVAEALLQE